MDIITRQQVLKQRPWAENAIRLYVDQKLTTTEVGKLVGKSGKSVSAMLRAVGLIRSKSEARTLSALGELHGRRFERLVVAAVLGPSPSTRKTLVSCACDCGGEVVVPASALKSGTTKSCGCLQKELAAARYTRDFSGQAFGRLTVHSRAEHKRGRVAWNCVCACGSKIVVAAADLARGDTTSCGCFKAEYGPSKMKQDLTGQRFGLRTVIQYAGRDSAKNSRWLTRCDCGKEQITPTTSLLNAGTMSCGCAALGGDDSVAAWISGKFRKQEEPAVFYVFSLHRFEGYAKPGIAVDLKKRIDTEYGDLHDFIEAPRLDAWLIEQAVLQSTRALAECPNELKESKWAGHSEVRRARAEDLFQAALQYHDLLQEHGREEFAEKFLVTSAAQRAALASMSA